jgi:hypothetical protein
MTRKQLLGLLLMLLAAAIGYAIWGTPRQETADRSQVRPRPVVSPGTTPAPDPAQDVRRVRLDLLREDDTPFPGFKRNIFGSILPPAPAPPVRPVAPLPPPPPPPPPPVAPAAMQQDLARLTFLGYLERDGVRRVFLSGDNELFVVGKDDRFGRNRQFQVIALTADKLVLRQGSDPREIVITLVEKAPLALQNSPFRRSAPAGRDPLPTRRAGSLLGSRAAPPEEEPVVEPEPTGAQEAPGGQEAPGTPEAARGRVPAPVPEPAVGTSPFATDSPLKSLSPDTLPPAVPSGPNEVKP